MWLVLEHAQRNIIIHGMLVYWYAGMLVCWYAGMLVCWYAGIVHVASRGFMIVSKHSTVTRAL
jgi:hypothetical protein